MPSDENNLPKINPFGLKSGEFAKAVKAIGLPAFRGDQVRGWIYNQLVCDPAQMTNLGAPDREKLAASLWLSLRKRPVTVEAVDASIARIEEKLLTLGEREIPSEKVGEMVMRELKKLDKVAYIRFASVYRNFEDVDEFSDIIREVSTRSVTRRGR